MLLREELDQELLRYNFISLSALHKLVHAASIQSCLFESGVTVQPNVLEEITSRSPKLFALLTLQGREYSIEDYHLTGFHDDNFPLLKEEDVPHVGSRDERLSIYRAQWKIPIVLEKSRHLDLPPEFVPPFLEERTVGHGAFGFVSRVRVADGHLPGYSSSTPIALKRIRKQDQDEWDVVMREVQTLRAREHPHIVPLLASYTEHSIESGYGVRSLNLFFPYAEMDMYQWLYLSKTPANLPKTWAQPQLKDYIYGIILSLCSALAYLHREVDGLISSHHDLKPKNIILFGQSWKIADFGRTHLIDLKTGSDTEGQCGLGTFTYNPPEYWDDLGRRANVRHGRAFDIWAMGCIIIELATVAVHGWSSEGLERFRQNRRENRARPLTFQSVEPSTDDSFHNNLGVVKDWFHKLEVFDGSSNLIQILEITSQMLDIDSRKRPSSWEIELNLSEVLNPNETNTVKADRTFSVIQRPGPNDLKGTHNPLQRAAMQGNKLRVRCLLDSGWHANMVDTQFIERNSQAQGCIKNEILDMLETSWQQANFAVVVQKLPWRRLMHQMREWQEKNHPQGYMEPKFKHDCKFATKYPVTALGTEIPWKQLLGGPPGVARKATERNAFHTSAFEQQDAAGMTSLHRACRDGNVWTVINLLGKLDSGFMRARLFTLQDATGKLPLHHAAKKGSSTMMLLLLESFKFGSITTFYPTSLATLRDFNGRTPIHMAAQSGNLVAIELLANASANAANYLNIRDDDGNTAWDLAAKYRQKEAADALAKLRFG